MKVRTSFLVAIALALVAGGLLAQPHPGGVLMGAGYPQTSTNYLNGLFIAHKDGRFSTLVDTYVLPARPYHFVDTQMGVDNTSVVFGCLGSSSSLYNLKYGLFSYDPDTQKFSTIASHTKDFATVYGVQATQDGDWWVNAKALVNNRAHYRVYRVTSSGWSPVLTTMQLGHVQNFTYPVGRDVDSGDLLIPSTRSVGFFARPVYALANDGTVSSWNISNGGPQPTKGWTQEIATGDMLYMNGTYLYRCPPGRSPTSSKKLTIAPESAYGLVFDNQSEATPLLILYSYRQVSTQTTANLKFVDTSTATPTVTKTVNFIQAPGLAQIPYPQAGVLNHRDRYIQTVKTGAAKWDMLFNLPAFPNKPYLAVASFSGVRPGFTLRDGRHVWLNYDDLFGLTATNRIAPLFNPGPLVLDGSGKAKGSIDLTGLLPLDVTVHLLLAVADAASPGGVAFITEPYPLQL